MVKLRVNFEDRKGEWFDLLFVEIREINHLLSETGWVVEKLITSDDPLDSLYGVVLRNTK